MKSFLNWDYVIKFQFDITFPGSIDRGASQDTQNNNLIEFNKLGLVLNWVSWEGFEQQISNVRAMHAKVEIVPAADNKALSSNRNI